jgi:hypothetical protein
MYLDKRAVKARGPRDTAADEHDSDGEGPEAT